MLDKSNWLINIGLLEYAPIGAPTAVGNVVSWVRSGLGGGPVAGDITRYLATNADLQSLGGLLAAPFDIPYVVI